MKTAWERYQERLEAAEKKQRHQRAFFSRVWIWRPNSKFTMSEQELRDNGYENLNEKEEIRNEW